MNLMSSRQFIRMTRRISGPVVLAAGIIVCLIFQIMNRDYGRAWGIITHHSMGGKNSMTDMSYEYQVKDVVHTGSSYNSNGPYDPPGKGEAADFWNKYPKGLKLWVYYRLDNPSVAVISPPGPVYLFWLSCVLILVGAGMTGYTWLGKKKR